MLDYLAEYVERIVETEEVQEAKHLLAGGAAHSTQAAQVGRGASTALGEYRKLVGQLRHLPAGLLMRHAVPLWALAFGAALPVRH